MVPRCAPISRPVWSSFTCFPLKVAGETSGHSALAPSVAFRRLSHSRLDSSHLAVNQSPGEDRLALAIQKPNITEVAEGTVTVQFTSGPNAFSHPFMVSCYNNTVGVPTTDCGAVVREGRTKLGFVSGTLSKTYSDVVVEVNGIPSNTEVDCFVSISGEPFGVVTKCQYAGTVTTPVSIRASVTAQSTGDPTELLVQAFNTSRALILDDAFGNTSDRSAVPVTLAVQCLSGGASGCDGSDPTLWTATTEATLFPPGSGQVVTGLVPNTEYGCFIALSYEEDGSTKYACSEPQTTAVADTMVAAPTATSVTVSGTTSPTTELVVSGTATVQGNVKIIENKVQCIDATLTTPSVCDTTGATPWVTANDLATGQVVQNLTPNTNYVCFAAATYNDNGTQYACSGPSSTSATEVAAPSSIATNPGANPATQIEVSATAAASGEVQTLGYAVQCIKTADVVNGACDPSGTNGPWQAATENELASGVQYPSSGALDASTAYTCFSAATYNNGSPQYACSAGSSITTGALDFYLAGNGVTVLCPNAAVGDSGDVVIGGTPTTFTKRDYAGMLALRNANDFAAMAATCTTGITTFFELFFNKATFDEDISHFDTSSITNTRNMFYGCAEFDGDIGDWDVSSVETMRYVPVHTHRTALLLFQYIYMTLTRAPRSLFRQVYVWWCLEVQSATCQVADVIGDQHAAHVCIVLVRSIARSPSVSDLHHVLACMSGSLEPLSSTRTFPTGQSTRQS